LRRSPIAQRPRLKPAQKPAKPAAVRHASADRRRRQAAASAEKKPAAKPTARRQARAEAGQAEGCRKPKGENKPAG